MACASERQSSLISLPGQVRTGTVGIQAAIDRLFIILKVRSQRRALLALDDRMLADIGLSRADAWHEGTRPLSDLPNFDIRQR